jgi:hypothetical protein
LYVAMEGFLIAIRDFEDYTDRDGEQSLENFMDQVGVSMNSTISCKLQVT